MKTKTLLISWLLLLLACVMTLPQAVRAQDSQGAVAQPGTALSNKGQAGSYLKQGNLLVLMYHDFSTEIPQDKERIQLASTGEKFAADIEALLELGYLPISLEDYYYGRAEQGQKYFAITFDDGYQGVYQIAWPVLREKQVPGAVFFNTGMEHYPAYLHYQQLQEMEESGLVKIYSHLAYHMQATKLPAEEYSRYLAASLKFLQRYVGEKTMFLAYPYGDYNEEVYQEARAQGIALQFVQKLKFPASDVLVRINVPYDADMGRLSKYGPHN